MLKLLRPLAIAAAALAAVPACASQITIDFESLPGADGVLGTADDTPTADVMLQPLGDLYAAIGLRFTQGTLFQADFYDGNPKNHFISSTNPIAILTQPVHGISIDSRSYWHATLTAYDSMGAVIASHRLANPTNGWDFSSGTLSVSSSQAIYGFSVLPDNPDSILNLDRLVLTTAQPAEVPEPAQTALFALGLALAGVPAMLRRRWRG